MNELIFKPQPGPQTQFLETSADICVYGGGAGGGKTWGILLDWARLAVNHPNINGIIFRRESTQLTLPGSIWPESHTIFSHLGAKPNNKYLQWKFPNRSVVKFSGLQYEGDKHNFDGTNLDWVGFDEVTQFSESQFFYLLSRLRSTTGAFRPYLRATCNPDSDSWLLELVRWWIKDDGYPNRALSGTIRWFFRMEDIMYWCNSEAEACQKLRELKWEKEVKPLSFTFIAAGIEDNQCLLQNDPDYITRLNSLPYIEKERLLKCNWFIKQTGKIFKQEYFKIFVVTPALFECILITVDTAQNTQSHNDFTVCQVWGRWENKIYLVEQARGKFDFMTQGNVLHSLILRWKPNWVAIELKSNGHALVQHIRNLIATPLIDIPRIKDKYARAKDIEGYVQSGYVYLNPALPYYAEFISEVIGFEGTGGKSYNRRHDDQVDAFVDAVYLLLLKRIGSTEEKYIKPPQPQKVMPYGCNTRPFLRSVTD